MISWRKSNVPQNGWQVTIFLVKKISDIILCIYVVYIIIHLLTSTKTKIKLLVPVLQDFWPAVNYRQVSTFPVWLWILRVIKKFQGSVISCDIFCWEHALQKGTISTWFFFYCLYSNLYIFRYMYWFCLHVFISLGTFNVEGLLHVSYFTSWPESVSFLICL